MVLWTMVGTVKSKIMWVDSKYILEAIHQNLLINGMFGVREKMDQVQIPDIWAVHLGWTGVHFTDCILSETPSFQKHRFHSCLSTANHCSSS